METSLTLNAQLGQQIDYFINSDDRRSHSSSSSSSIKPPIQFQSPKSRVSIANMSTNQHQQIGSYFLQQSKLNASSPPSPPSAGDVEPLPTELNTVNCSGKFIVVSPDKLSVQYTIVNLHYNDVGVVQANHPAPVNCLAYYFKMKVLNCGTHGYIAIGFTPPDFQMCRQPGWEVYSYGYHGDEGILYCNQDPEDPVARTFTMGDVAGVGINFTSHELFFTKNGVIVGTLFKNVTRQLFPTLCVGGDNEEVTVNFGKDPFVFDLKAYKAQELSKLQTMVEKLTLQENSSHKSEFNQEYGRRDLTEMIILHEYPVTMVDHYGFKKLCETLQPNFEVPCINTTKKDILKRYSSEKENMVKLLKETEGKIALTVEIWTLSNKKKRYIAVSAHFVDSTWKLQSLILRFLYVEAPHTKEVLADTLCKCINDWNLSCCISSITLDNCTTNDVIVPILRAKLPKSSHILSGKFLRMRCCGHILHLIVQDGLSVVRESIEKVRNSVVFWTASVSRVSTFENTARTNVKNYSKKLKLDCKTRWNSTYEMLKVAITYKKVFDILSSRESEPYKCSLLDEDWEQVEKVCEKLEVFKEVVCDLPETKYCTANEYFTILCDIRCALAEWLQSTDSLNRKMATIMLKRYNEYWNDVNAFLAVAAVLDPRYKMPLVSYYYKQIYEDHEVYFELEKLNGLLRQLVSEYSSKYGEGEEKDLNNSSTSSTSTKVGRKPKLKGFAKFMEVDLNHSGGISELQKYLEAPNVPITSIKPNDFDVLSWWKTNGSMFPILQMIARDILSIPASIMPPKLTYDMSERMLSAHCSSLLPSTVEVLMCAQNWIRANIKDGDGSKEVEYQQFINDIDEEEFIAYNEANEDCE